MSELTGLLSAWIFAAGVPATALIAFFWKGDDALSTEFKQWLSDRLSGINVTPRQEGLGPLGGVFDRIFGPLRFSINSFLRVAAISTIAAAISLIAMALVLAAPFELVVELLQEIFSSQRTGLFFLLLSLQSILDYISVFKARFIMREMVKVDVQYKIVLFFLLDAAATIGLLVAYNHIYNGLVEYFFPRYMLPSLDFWFLWFSFCGTTFLVFFLTLLYLFSLWTLIVVRKVPILSFVVWVLPIRTFPIRSIGLMSGIILFFGLTLANLLNRFMGAGIIGWILQLFPLP